MTLTRDTYYRLEGTSFGQNIYPQEFHDAISTLLRIGKPSVDDVHLIEINLIHNALRTCAMSMGDITIGELDKIVGAANCKLLITIQAGALADKLLDKGEKG